MFNAFKSLVGIKNRDVTEKPIDNSQIETKWGMPYKKDEDEYSLRFLKIHPYPKREGQATQASNEDKVENKCDVLYEIKEPNEYVLKFFKNNPRCKCGNPAKYVLCALNDVLCDRWNCVKYEQPCTYISVCKVDCPGNHRIPINLNVSKTEKYLQFQTKYKGDLCQSCGIWGHELVYYEGFRMDDN